MKDQSRQNRAVSTNKKAQRDYFIQESEEAGIELKGTEVKSIREGKVNLNDAHARIQNGEMFLFGMHISPYDYGNQFNHDPLRPRKLLLHKKQIIRMKSLSEQQGFAIIPLRIYLKRGIVKVDVALCKGKRLYDKREEIKRKTALKETQRALKQYR